ncbi:MAG TPA: 4-alpha-glucanotransferase, partial [Tepidisphaeraceae bacterium]|nr:4-alpha-glucanotransferase [Tepidisphaeraceae bacterium]
DALRSAQRELADAINRHRFTQFLFFRQLDQLKRYANDHRVRLIGDLPIFISGDSADVWSHPHLFQLDKHRRPTVVAGVPPDLFSKTGQRWGNPIYNWPAMQRDNFAWWIARFRSALTQADLVRIDHFRGFAACWQIPADHPTAEHGRWVKAPGRQLFQTIRQQIGQLPFIAEDLGTITPDVESLRDNLRLPGMRILHFAFNGDPTSPYLPHNYIRNAVAYTGTHDNDTTVGWFNTLPPKHARFLHQYLGHPCTNRDIAWSLIRLCWSSVADCAIAPLQDVLSLGSKARMNVPGTCNGNWRWRVREAQLKTETLDRLAEMTTVCGRAPHAG